MRAYHRGNWSESSDRERIVAEYHYLRGQLDRGNLPALTRDGDGWARTGFS